MGGGERGRGVACGMADAAGCNEEGMGGADEVGCDEGVTGGVDEAGCEGIEVSVDGKIECAVELNKGCGARRRADCQP